MKRKLLLIVLMVSLFACFLANRLNLRKLFESDEGSFVCKNVLACAHCGDLDSRSVTGDSRGSNKLELGNCEKLLEACANGKVGIFF